jgi:hypothetical protein
MQWRSNTHSLSFLLFINHTSPVIMIHLFILFITNWFHGDTTMNPREGILHENIIKPLPTLLLTILKAIDPLTMLLAIAIFSSIGLSVCIDIYSSPMLLIETIVTNIALTIVIFDFELTMLEIVSPLTSDDISFGSDVSPWEWERVREWQRDEKVQWQWQRDEKVQWQWQRDEKVQWQWQRDEKVQWQWQRDEKVQWEWQRDEKVQWEWQRDEKVQWQWQRDEKVQWQWQRDEKVQWQW